MRKLIVVWASTYGLQKYGDLETRTRAVADPGFPGGEGGTNPKGEGEGANLLFGQIFLKTV